MKNHSRIFFTIFFLLGIIFTNCKKENSQLPDNPFDKIDYPDTTKVPYQLERNSISDLHKRIFSPKCAQPGCHDGNFEPDFRSIESSYATLVYHPIIKNNVNEDFDFRVVPFDTAYSVLFERITNCCFVNTNDRMPQDNIGVALLAQDVADIADWIMKGAKDIFGKTARYPNTKPYFEFYFATKSDFSVFYSIDSIYRIDGIPFNPFQMPNNTNVIISFVIQDDSTLTKDLKVNQLKLSTERDNFSNAITLNCTYLNIPGQGEFWVANFNTSSLPNNTILYMRYYVHDGNPQNLIEFPTNEQPSYYKTYTAFKVLP